MHIITSITSSVILIETLWKPCDALRPVASVDGQKIKCMVGREGQIKDVSGYLVLCGWPPCRPPGESPCQIYPQLHAAGSWRVPSSEGGWRSEERPSRVTLTCSRNNWKEQRGRWCRVVCNKQRAINHNNNWETVAHFNTKHNKRFTENDLFHTWHDHVSRQFRLHSCRT